MLMRHRIARRCELPYLAAPDDFVLVRSEFREGKWPAAVQLLSADTHLSSEAEFGAVGEAGGRVPIDCGGVDSTQEPASVGFIGGDNRIGMLGRILVDVRFCFVYNGDH